MAMRVTRLAHAALGLLLLVLAADPVVAQSRNADLITNLNQTLLYAARTNSRRPSAAWARRVTLIAVG